MQQKDLKINGTLFLRLFYERALQRVLYNTEVQSELCNKLKNSKAEGKNAKWSK